MDRRASAVVWSRGILSDARLRPAPGAPVETDRSPTVAQIKIAADIEGCPQLRPRALNT
jgi:hypothetical protein